MRNFLSFLIIFLIIFCFCCGCNRQQRQTHITFSSWGSKTETAVVKRLLAEFEMHNPEIKVEFVHAPANYFQKLHLLFSAKLQPDVLMLNNYYFPQYHHYGLLENLMPYFQEEIKEKVFHDEALAAFERDGKLWALPRDVSNVVVYFNKKLFDSLQLKYPSVNWKYSEMIELSKSFATAVPNKKIYGISFSEKFVFWLPFLAVNNARRGDLCSFLTDGKSIKILQEYADLPNHYKVAPLKKELAGRTQAQVFMDGEMAMYIGGRWNMPKFLEINSFEWGVVPFPMSDKPDLQAPLDVSGWAISKNSKNKEAALKLLKFLSSSKSVAAFSETGLIVPARVDVSDEASFVLASPFVLALKQSRPFLFDKESKNILENFELTLAPAFIGAQSVPDAVKSGFPKN